ncbi:MAG: GntR family transcriptional regulator [Kiritimatiellaeota bacterium]|nr:GntR family transcriptional regulator [Kiritimatiellota bacterium]
MQTGLPAYKTLASRLRASVARGRCAPGERVASEHELSRRHGLARVTVRKATELLVAEGLLERRPGKGLYVRDAKAAGVVKILVGNLAWEPSVRIVRGAQQAARERGYELQVCDAHGDAGADMESVARLAGNGAKGALIVALHTPAFYAAVARLKAENFPFVLVDTHYREEIGIPSVAADNYQGGFLAGTRIAKLGHARAAFVGDAGASTVADRLDGFRDGLAEHGVALPRAMVRDIVAPDPFADWGELVRAACGELLRGKDRPTAVFCSCDAVARFCCRFCAEKHLNVPGDISVVGFDDDPMAEWLTPGLATVRQPFAEMGATAMRLLAAQLAGADAPRGHHALPVEWVGRGSLAKPGRTAK